MNLQRMKCGWWSALIIGWCTQPLIAQTSNISNSPAVWVSLDEIPARVMEFNPEIQTALWTILEAENRLTQSGRLKNPNLITSFNENQRTPERWAGVGIQQSFPITGRLRLEKSVSKLKIREAETEVKMVARSLIESALATAAQWFGNRERHSIMEDQIQLAKELATFLSNQSAKGEVSSLDALQASLEADELALGLRPLVLERKQLESSLRIQLGLKPGTQILIKGDLPEAKIPSAKNILMESRPDYLHLQNQIDTTEESIKLARANRISDISLQLMHQWNREEDMPIGIEKERNAQIQLSVPLPLWNRNQGQISELMNKNERLKSSKRALELSISNHADAAFTGMIEQLAIYKQIKNQSLPKRVTYQKALEDSYKQGLSSFELLLRARDQILKLRLAQSDALIAFHINRIKYQSEIGNLPNFHESFPIQTKN